MPHDRSEERRKDRRKNVRSVPIKSPVSGGVLEVGPGGMLIESHEWLAVGSRRTFTLGADQRTARVRGEVRWCRLAGTLEGAGGEVHPVYRAGVAFVE